MSRLVQIALRDYIAYVRTPGFWLSIILVPVGIMVFGGSSALMARTTRSQPSRWSISPVRVSPRR